ncbi:MAG TPA: LacI family DNA-binding transcriptional regulator [Ktedonobacteraceae bacterium]|nr:LacI family DNA-binding transcriptional regulator [Ktedonobacteraceae bacterium]
MNQDKKQASSRRQTIAEIASKAGVSIPTVSRVLNNRPDVAPETRTHVERIIQESGFIRNRMANALRQGTSGLVDLVIPDLDSPYTVEVVRGVTGAIQRTAFRLALSVTYQTYDLEQQWLDRVLSASTDGVILLLARGQSHQLDELRRRDIPFVVVDHRGELGIDVPSVGATNWLGGRTATEYLLSLKHRRIGLISGAATLRCSLDRIAGYRAALESAGITIDPELIRPGNHDQATGYEQTCALLDLPDPPTAIFAGCDVQAMGVYSALRARGIRIPEQMSVIGFDDVQISALVTPTLTTIHQPLAEMGRTATSMLLRLIAGEPLDSIRAELTTSLIVRESCAPPSL